MVVDPRSWSASDQMGNKQSFDQAARKLQLRLAANLRDGRLRLGWTQEHLAQEAGLAPRHIQKLEAGEVNLTLRTIGRLCAALEMDASTLFREGSRNR